MSKFLFYISILILFFVSCGTSERVKIKKVGVVKMKYKVFKKIDTDFPYVIKRYIYDGDVYPDPFEPKEEIGLSGLDFSNITLVGVVWGEGGKIAIVKDQIGKFYFLHEGDQIRNGIVYEIREKEVIFEISEYGVKVKYGIKLGGRRYRI
ncbi:hypothetical protein DRN73_05680 [Candidatus Pacearchaeota archaeon]|nr:MAG: hypothetical protein DRN73_05680 [Candidatus Pacearchaeota archaeon]